MIIRVIFPDGSVKHLHVILWHKETNPKDYLDVVEGGMFPKISLLGGEQKNLGFLFSPHRPEEWYGEGDLKFIIEGSISKNFSYKEIGRFSIRISPELLTAIRDTAQTETSILLKDINEADARRRQMSLPERHDSFASTRGKESDLTSVNPDFPDGFMIFTPFRPATVYISPGLTI